ncbi:GNAT family N-acetyltransferase [Eubacteriales bacterium mix99]
MEKIREMGREYYSQMYDLASYSFNFGQKTNKEVAKFNEISAGSWNYGYFDVKTGCLMSQVMATPFDVNLHGQVYNMIGIGYVSTYPEFRGHGAINQLMTKILQDANARDVDLSYLAPFSYDFYEKYGYRLAFHRLRYKVNNEKFRIMPTYDGVIERCEYEKIIPELLRIFNSMPQNQKGGVIRRRWWLDYKFGNKDILFAVYRNPAGEVEGYMAYEFDDEVFVIRDLGFLTYEALSSLLHFCQSHAGTFRDFVFSIGYHGTLFDTMSRDIFSTQMSICADMMARIINIQRFVSHYPFRHDFFFSFYVTEDRFAPWNTGGYQVTVKDGKAKVERVEQKGWDITGNIQAYTELFMGSRKPSELLFAKRISGNREVVEGLEDCIHTGQPILEEYF